MQAHKAMLSLVIVMGVLILVGTAALIGVVVHRLSGHAHRTISAVTSVPAPGDPSTMQAISNEPPGTHILSLVRQSDTVLSIALSGGGPDRVLIWDVVGNRKLAELVLGR